MTIKMKHCPSCHCRIIVKTHRTFTDKLRGVTSKYRCHDCSKQFESRKRVSQRLFGVKFG